MGKYTSHHLSSYGELKITPKLVDVSRLQFGYNYSNAHNIYIVNVSVFSYCSVADMFSGLCTESLEESFTDCNTSILPSVSTLTTAVRECRGQKLHGQKNAIRQAKQSSSPICGWG